MADTGHGPRPAEDSAIPADTILVTGGTGTTGSRLASRLAALGFPVRTGSRHPGAAAGNDSVTPVRFDWSDESTHGPALDGVRRLYLVPPTSDPDPAQRMLPFLERALAAGVRRAVLLSSSAIDEETPGVGEMDRALRTEVPEWAVLRPSWFMQNFTAGHFHAANIRAEGAIVTATGDGRVAFVDADDIAAVAARALTDTEPHNAAHLITGPEALGYADIAATLSTVSGRPVRHVSVPVDDMCARLEGWGIPAPFARLLAEMDEAIAKGAENRTTDTVRDVTGRAPRSFASFAETNASSLPTPTKPAVRPSGPATSGTPRWPEPGGRLR